MQPVKQLPTTEAKRRKLLRTSNLLPRYFTALKRLVDFDLINASTNSTLLSEVHFSGWGPVVSDQILEGTAMHRPNILERRRP